MNIAVSTTIRELIVKAQSGFEVQVPEYKLRNPKAGDRVVRERLSEYLDQRDTRRLIVIHARAGQGKSSFAADFLRRTGRSFSWYSIDSWDSSELRLVCGIRAAIQHGVDKPATAGRLGNPVSGPEDGLMEDLSSRLPTGHCIVIHSYAQPSGQLLTKTARSGVRQAMN